MENTEEKFGALSERVIGAAIEVHRLLGPGLLESAHEQCLARDFALCGLTFRRQVDCPVEYKGLKLEAGFRADFVVEDALNVELKSVEALLPVHKSQIATYLRLSGLSTGLGIHFNVAPLRDGIKRIVV